MNETPPPPPPLLHDDPNVLVKIPIFVWVVALKDKSKNDKLAEVSQIILLPFHRFFTAHEASPDVFL